MNTGTEELTSFEELETDERNPWNLTEEQQNVYGRRMESDYRFTASSDQALRDALRSQEVHNAHFSNTNVVTSPNYEIRSEYISHMGFDYIRDLDKYIKELQDQVKEYKIKWSGTASQQGLNERLEELNAKIEAKYANYRNGANRDADPEIEGLEEEYLDLLDLQEKELKTVNDLVIKIKELQWARQRWVQDCKERYSHPIKQRGELLKQLEAAKKELKELELKKYNGESSQFIDDRIEALKQIIKELEEEINKFHNNMGLGIVTVEFDTGLGKHPDFDYKPINIGKGKTIEKPVDPILDEEHELECWTLNGEPFDFSTPINDNIKLVAKYREKVKEYKVTFNFDNGEEPLVVTVAAGGKVEKPTDPTKEGFEFNSWTLGENEFDFDSEITEDIELTANYLTKSKKTAKDTCTVTFNFDNGEEPLVVTVPYGERVAKPLDPQKDGYKFENWTLGDVGVFDFDLSITDDIQLDANYKKMHRVQIFGGKLGKKSIFENKLFTIEVPDGEKIDFDAIENSPEFKANNIAQEKRIKILRGWAKINGDDFDINQPINESMSIMPNYKRDLKRIVSNALGLGVGAITYAIDQQVFQTPGVVSGTTTAVMTGAAIGTKYKLKNHLEPVEITEEMTRLKKGTTKFLNIFRKNENIRNLYEFFRNAAISAGIATVVDNITPEKGKDMGEEQIKDIGGDHGNGNENGNGNVNGNENYTEPTLGSAYNPNNISQVNDTAIGAIQNINPEDPIRQYFNAGIPTEALNVDTGQRIAVSDTDTLTDILAKLGSTDGSNISFNVTTRDGSTPLGWVACKDVFKNIEEILKNASGMGR